MPSAEHTDPDEGATQPHRSAPGRPVEERPRLLAISDLHVEVPENRAHVEALRPETEDDWLIVCGDVADAVADVEWALGVLAGAFSRVIWVPGNHELWTRPDDPVALRGEARYRHLVECCRRLSVVTPEDPFPVWPGEDGPVVVAPLFTLYDYSFAATARPRATDAVCADELVLFCDPHPSPREWCADRVRSTEARLATEVGDRPTVLVNHFPLLRALTRPLRVPGFERWCGTLATADWHTRFGAVAVVYGHLHIPSTTVHDGVAFHEVSLGYAREWRRRGGQPPSLRRIL